jgi:hypothetical protein
MVLTYHYYTQHTHTHIYIYIQGDQKVSVHLIFFLWGAIKNSVYSNNPDRNDDLKMAITEYIRTVGRAILNTVFENTVRPVNKLPGDWRGTI